MIWAAVYDISDDGERSWAASVIQAWGFVRVQRSLYVGRLQRAADLAAVLARRVKTGHVALIPVTDLRGALEVGTPPYAPLKLPRYVRSWHRPTPWDVLELEWCPRYLWLSKRHGVPVTPSMAKGKAEEGVLRKRLAAALGGEPRPVYIDAGWAHGVVDMLARGRSAVPVEIKTGVPRREHKWQVYAEAYLVKTSLMSVSQAVGLRREDHQTHSNRRRAEGR
jgi:CRISPR-associated protein Cas4